MNENQQQQLAADATSYSAVSPDSDIPQERHSARGAANVRSFTPAQVSTAATPHAARSQNHDTYNSANRAGSNSDPQESDQINRIVSRAANILRESIEVEGVVFLDASVHSFGGYHNIDNSSASDSTVSGSESQEDFDTNRQSSPEPQPLLPSVCCILGFSTSDISSIDDGPDSSFQLTVPEKLLAKLLRRYPEGKIFNFDEHGYAKSRDSSGDEDAVQMPEPANIVVRHTSSQASTSQGSHNKSDGSAVLKIFAGARSIALLPVWDPRRQRWFAGGFAFTKNPSRIFTVEGELSYLRAFSTVVMAEISRAEIAVSDGAKSDALSSISHELRSPLHGLLLAAELLSYVNFDAFQSNMLHTIETCGRTLLGEHRDPCRTHLIFR